MSNYIATTINDLLNYPEDVLRAVIKLLNVRYNPNTIKEYEIFKANYIELDVVNLWLFSLRYLSDEERDLLLKYGFLDLSTGMPTDKLYELEYLIMSVFGWDKWDYTTDPTVATKILKEKSCSCNFGKEDQLNGCVESCNATLSNYAKEDATSDNFDRDDATLSNFCNTEKLHSNFLKVIEYEDFWEKLAERIEALKKYTPYKKNTIGKYITQLKFLKEPQPKSQYIDMVCREYQISHQTVETHIKILKHPDIGWVEVFKGEYDKPYLKLTYKFYEDIRDLIDQYLPKKEISDSEDKDKTVEELRKHLKKLIEKHITPEGFEFDINEVDELEGIERVAGAYFRDKLLNEPYTAIEWIYKVYYEKYFTYKPININIVGLETLAGSRIITKVEDWGAFKDKLVVLRGDIAGIIKHKVRRDILLSYKCEDYDKNGEKRGCGYELKRLYRPLEGTADHKVKCPNCGREIKAVEPILKDVEGDEVKLEKDLTVILLQLRGSEELYKVYLPYTPEINNLRDVEIVGILKTNYKGEYYIEGLSINPQKTINFNYDAFVRKVKKEGYDNALDYIKDKVFYEIKRIYDKEGKNPTIDTLIETEILASAHIWWDSNRKGYLKPETIDALFIGSYGQGKSLTIEPLAKLHNTTEDTIRVDMPNIENLIGLITSRDNIKYFKKGLIPMNHNRPIIFEEFIDFILRLGNDIDLLKAGKTAGIWKREREGYNIPMIGVSPWIGIGNIKDIELMELWEIYHLKGVEEFKEALINYYTKKLLEQYEYNREDARKRAEKIVDNILGIYPELGGLSWLLTKILDFTLKNMRGMTDRIPLIYLLKPYTNEDWKEIKLHSYSVKKSRKDQNFIKYKELEAYECSLFINYIKNKDIEFNKEALVILWDIEEKLRELLRDNDLFKGYSDRLLNQIEYIAKAYAKLRFKEEVELEDVRDALKTWFKSILGVLLRIKAPEKVKELFKLVEGEEKDKVDEDEKELEEIDKLIEENKKIMELKGKILDYMLQNPEKEYTTIEISEVFKLSEDTADKILKELWKVGDVMKIGDGQWKPV
ncbi:hypothetical protein ACO3VM_09455 (plasmid) [Methanocaldococcus sp. 10A]